MDQYIAIKMLQLNFCRLCLYEFKRLELDVPILLVLLSTHA